MTTEDKFRAAVNVIRSLPKNGSYQPSYDLMLRFYAYYKQATEGECKEAQPPFWDLVKRKKRDAWNRLGTMTRHEAMERYVEELKKIVETMSYTDNVANFLESLGTFYETVPQDDLNMLVGNIMERVSSRDGSPQRTEPLTCTNGTMETDSDTEEFIDTVESTADSESDSGSRPKVNGFVNNGESSHSRDVEDSWSGKTRSRGKDKGPAVVKSSLNGHAVIIPEDSNSLTTQISLTSHTTAPLDVETSVARINDWVNMNGGSTNSNSTDVNEHLRATIKQLQRDLDSVTTRVRSLEVTKQSSEAQRPKSVATSWWPLSDVSPHTAAFVVLWPFIAHLAISFWRQRRNRH